MDNEIKVIENEEQFVRAILQYQDDLAILLNSGFFNFKNGVATCHRDFAGKLRKIEVQQIIFKS